jgi:hypothetical protein
MTSHRKQVLILSSVVPLITLPAIFVLPQLHGVALRVFVICYALAMAAMLVYAVSQMVKLKRRVR